MKTIYNKHTANFSLNESMGVPAGDLAGRKTIWIK